MFCFHRKLFFRTKREAATKAEVRKISFTSTSRTPGGDASLYLALSKAFSYVRDKSREGLVLDSFVIEVDCEGELGVIVIEVTNRY